MYDACNSPVVINVFLSHRRKLTSIRQNAYNPVFDSFQKKKSLYPLYLLGVGVFFVVTVYGNLFSPFTFF